MIVNLIQELRSRKIAVGTAEALVLAQALSLGLHENSLDQFYFLARSILIHDESQLDDFDQVFFHLYKGIAYQSKDLIDELSNWLKNPLTAPELTEDEKKTLQALNIEELKKLFEERLREQTERHDGGNYWIGTGGKSPFGTGGYHPSGISLNQGSSKNATGGRSSLRSADARKYRSYRNDLTLDVRQIEVALRKLRNFDRHGAHSELDLEKSIDETARNFGELEVVFRKPRRPNTRVILMMDVGGSMDPFARLISQLFSAAKRATHWKELRTYYFHNCIYGKVYKTEGLKEPVLVRDLLKECDSRYHLIVTGDATMAPYELLGSETDQVSALQWLYMLRNQFPKSVWLNPDLSPGWQHPTVEAIAEVFAMFPLSIGGLEEAITFLHEGAVGAPSILKTHKKG